MLPRPQTARRLRLARVLCLASAVASAVLLADAALTQRASDAFQRKVLGIQRYASDTGLTGARLTPFSEAELNSYIRYALGPQIPTGVVEPYVEIVGGNQLRARAVVDLDVVRKSKPRGWLDPLAYLSGRMPVTASGALSAADGRARFEFADATISGVPVPKAALQELVGYYSQSPQYPSGVDLDAPFDLPARIKEIHVEAGQAIVVQR